MLNMEKYFLQQTNDIDSLYSQYTAIQLRLHSAISMVGLSGSNVDENTKPRMLVQCSYNPSHYVPESSLVCHHMHCRYQQIGVCKEDIRNYKKVSDYRPKGLIHIPNQLEEQILAILPISKDDQNIETILKHISNLAYSNVDQSNTILKQQLEISLHFSYDKWETKHSSVEKRIIDDYCILFAKIQYPELFLDLPQTVFTLKKFKSKNNVNSSQASTHFKCNQENKRRAKSYRSKANVAQISLIQRQSRLIELYMTYSPNSPVVRTNDNTIRDKTPHSPEQEVDNTYKKDSPYSKRVAESNLRKTSKYKSKRYDKHNRHEFSHRKLKHPKSSRNKHYGRDKDHTS